VNARQLTEVATVRDMLRTGRARQLRLDAGLSAAEVAHAADIAASTLWRYENHERIPRAPHALALGKVYRRLRVYIDKTVADAALEELAERLSYAEGAACDYWRDRCWRAEDKLAASDDECVRPTELMERAERRAVEEGVKRAEAEEQLAETVGALREKLTAKDRAIIDQQSEIAALEARIAEFTTNTCPVCEGSGYEPNRLTTAAAMTCHNCGGLGWVTVGPAAADLAARAKEAADA